MDMAYIYFAGLVALILIGWFILYQTVLFVSFLYEMALNVAVSYHMRSEFQSIGPPNTVPVHAPLNKTFYGYVAYGGAILSPRDMLSK